MSWQPSHTVHRQQPCREAAVRLIERRGAASALLAGLSITISALPVLGRHDD